MPLRILLIEDDPDIQKMVRLSLMYQGGHQVSVASGGEEGLSKATAENPDLILLDVMMPEMDGYETCKRLKSQPGTRHIPVVFLSARAQQTEIQKGRELGAVGYLVKPFDPMTLSSQLDAIIGTADQD
ncbi:MAG TPA: response regulator [Symbiobacteriaceae bacterium]|jgi:CheY-like chemotaxis protein